MSSTTFDAQLDVATRVAAENPDLYYEIQSLNEYGVESLNALQAAVDRLCRSVREGDAPAFVAMMRQGDAYLRVRQAAREDASR
jgi:chorismate mutase/prephenate dehydrogenase